MATTTAARIKSIAKHLKELPDSDIEVFIDDAYMEVSDLNVKEEYEERLTRYLAAHLASLNVRQAMAEKVADMSRSYAPHELIAGKGLELTAYGQEYKRLVKKYGPPKLNLVVY